MTDDELTRGLRAWADATDPATDPIKPDDVTTASASRGVPSGARPTEPAAFGSRRWLAAAAAVLVVLAVGAAVVLAVGSDDEPDVLTRSGPRTGTRTQVVVDGEDLDALWWQTAHRVVLHGPCPDEACGGAPAVVARALEAGTSLAVDQALAPGRWLVGVETYRCGGEDRDCGPPTADGTPSDPVEGLACGVPFDVGSEPSRVVLEVRAGPDDAPRCSEARVDPDPLPDLTVPPAWSVRSALPWTCGAATHQINGMVPGPDPEGALDTLACFRDAIATGTPVEIPAMELGAADSAVRGRWRVLPEAVDGHLVEVLRNDGGWWSRQRCDDVEVEPADVLVDPGPSLHVGAVPVGCGDEEQLPLDLPPLDGPAPPAPAPPTSMGPTSTSPPTTTPSSPTTAAAPSDPPPAGTVDVVLDGTDLPSATPPTTWTWSIHLGDEEAAVATGTVTGDSAEGYPSPPIALLADDLVVPDGTEWVGLRIDDGAGTENLCLADAPPEGGGRVAVVRIATRTCTPAWVDAVPALTVPPTWSRRSPAAACTDLAPDARWGQCFADLAIAGEGVAERSDQRAGVLTTYRVEDGALTVVRRVIAPDAVTWTTQACAGLFPAADGRGLVPEACSDEEPLPLAPS